MKQYLIMCRSLTYAQRSQRILNSVGISSYIVKAPMYLRTGGCGYALNLKYEFDRAVLILKENSVLRGKLYSRRSDDEIWEEIL